MATPDIRFFYRFDTPRGITVKKFVEWTTSSAADLVITPASLDVYFVKYIGVLISSDADLGTDNLTITHSSDVFGGEESATITYSSIDEVISSFGPATITQIGCNLKGTIVFDVPIRLDQSQSDVLTIAYSGAGGITAGQINITVHGWYIDNEADI